MRTYGLWIVLTLSVIGMVLGALASISLPLQYGISGFWVALVVLVNGSIWFGGWGVLAGTLFPMAANGLAQTDWHNILAFVPADLVQGLIPAWAFRNFRTNPAIPGTRGLAFYCLWGTAIPSLAGGILAATALVVLNSAPWDTFPAVAAQWTGSNIVVLLLVGIPALRGLTPLWHDLGVLVKGWWVIDRRVRHIEVERWRFRNMPIQLKLVLAMCAAGFGPLVVLAILELSRNGGHREPGDLTPLFLTISIVATVLAVGFLSRETVRPLLRLKDQVGLLVKDHHGSLSVDRGDEIGQLGLAFAGLLEERKLAETDLRIAATALEAQEGIVICDARGVILRVNQAFTNITGYLADEAIGQRTNLLKSGRHDSVFYQQMWEKILCHGTWKGEIWNRRKTGEIYPEWLAIATVRGADGNPTHFVGTFNDMTSRKEAEDQIKELAYYDPLTGLPNRRLLIDRLHQALASCVRNLHEGALLFIDLDHFKTINDTQGHDKGDLLLREVAKRLTANLREADTVARIGGDEFVLVLADLNENAEEAAAQAEIVGEKVLAVLGQPYLISGKEFRSTPSIGITLFGGRSCNIEELMKQADIAMYQAKASGRNTWRFFDPDLHATITARVTMEQDLLLGLKDHQFVLHYQPQLMNGQLRSLAKIT